MRKKILIILLITASISAQQISDKFSSAVGFYNDHNFGTAFQIFKEIISENKLDEQNLASAKFYSADCLLNLNQLDGAASELESFIDQYKYSNYRDAALYKLGTIYVQKGEYRKARERLSTLLMEYKNGEYYGSAYYWIGEAFFAESKFIDAIENFKEAISQKLTNRFIVNSYYSLGQVYEKTNDYSLAVASYDELLAYYKDDPMAPKSQMRIGVCYFILKDYDNAILELTDPLVNKLQPKELIEAKYFLASSYSRLKDYNNAEQVYTNLLNNPEDESIKNKINFSLAWIYFQQNKYDEAYKIFNQLSENPSDSLKIQSLYWSGECKRYLGDINSANAIFKLLIEKYPEHPLASKAQLGIGSLLFNNSNTADAEKALLNATISEDKPTRGRAYTLLGEIRLNRKLFDEAKKYFSEALKLTSNQSELNNRALFGLSVSEYYLNNYDTAIKNLEELKLRAKNFENDKVNFYLAESYFSKGQYAASLKNYNSIKSSSEDLIRQSVLGKGYSYFNLKDFPNSIYYFNEFLAKYKSDKNINEVKLRLADSYFGNKNFDKASGIYREIFSKEKVDLNNDLAYYQYGQSLFKAGKASEAIEVFQNLQEKFPRSKYRDESQYVIGWINFQQNKFDEAIKSYMKLIESSSRSNLKPVAYYSIGDSYFNLGQYDSSIVFYSKVLTEYPNTQYIFDAVSGIQYAYVAEGKPEQAINFIDQFIAANPSSKYNDQLFFKKGDLYYSIQKYDEAMKIYKEFIDKYPSSTLIANAYYWIGKSAANMKNETEAINNFTFAKARSPKSDIGISSAIELANIYSSKNQFSAAVSVLKESSDAVPTSNRVPELLFLQGVNEVKDNKIAEAASIYDQIINYYEGSIFSAKAKVELGILKLKQNNYEEAQALLKEVGDKRTDDIGAQAQYYYGVSLFNQNKIEDAISALVRVRSVYGAYDEWYSKSLLMLGDCYVKLKDKKQAREMYRAVLSKHPTGELATEAKRKMNQL
ncbi:MAG: tetratricopeptide repeat protein [Ignavibacteriales bacterium]|nr:tetratricopeptide repeat protein [Ignavibacteriales bacterium]